MSNDEILTVKETAVLLKTTRQQVRKHALAGPKDDGKRRTPCRESRQGVESAESGDCGVF